MKHCLIPCAVLIGICAVSLINARCVSRQVDTWCSALDAAQQAAERGDWDGAEADLRAVYDAWREAQTYFHVITVHSELDEVEALFSRTFVYAGAGDAGEFCADAAELVTQLRLLDELQEISVKNIL